MITETHFRCAPTSPAGAPRSGMPIREAFAFQFDQSVEGFDFQAESITQCQYEDGPHGEEHSIAGLRCPLTNADGGAFIELSQITQVTGYVQNDERGTTWDSFTFIECVYEDVGPSAFSLEPQLLPEPGMLISLVIGACLLMFLANWKKR